MKIPLSTTVMATLALDAPKVSQGLSNQSSFVLGPPNICDGLFNQSSFEPKQINSDCLPLNGSSNHACVVHTSGGDLYVRKETPSNELRAAELNNAFLGLVLCQKIWKLN